MNYKQLYGLSAAQALADMLWLLESDTDPRSRKLFWEFNSSLALKNVVYPMFFHVGGGIGLDMCGAVVYEGATLRQVDPAMIVKLALFAYERAKAKKDKEMAATCRKLQKACISGVPGWNTPLDPFIQTKFAMLIDKWNKAVLDVIDWKSCEKIHNEVVEMLGGMKK